VTTVETIPKPPTTSAPTDVLTIVRLSPVHVAAHDRPAWLDLFASDAVVEDPIGAAPCHKHDGGLERFWDALLAPNAVTLELREELAQGDDAIRDVTIVTELAPGVTAQVPAYLFYRTRLHDGTRRIERLAGHWSLLSVSYRGPAAWKPLLAQLVRVMRGFDLPWVYAYFTSALRGVGKPGVGQLHALSQAVKARDIAALKACFVDGGVQLRLGDSVATSADEFLALLPPGSKLSFEAPITAGWTTAARFRVEGPSPMRGLVVFEHPTGNPRFRSGRFFVAP
jgi:hypothetical protein